MRHRHSHTTVLAKNYINSTPIIGKTAASKKSLESGVLYRGIGHVIDDENILAVKVRIQLQYILFDSPQIIRGCK